MMEYILEKKAFIKAIDVLEDVIKINSQVSLNDYFRRFEENNKGAYSFQYVEYFDGTEPATILCYVFNNDITENHRKVAFTAISTASVPVYTPIMIHKGENGLIGYPSDLLEPYFDHIQRLNNETKAY